MLLGVCYGNGIGCEVDLARSATLIRSSADMGVELAQYTVALRHGPRERERFRWLAKAAPEVPEARAAFADHLMAQDDGEGVFEMGLLLRSRIGPLQLWGHPANAEVVARAQRAVALHSQWCEEAGRAVRTWLLVALRSGLINRDIRRLVATVLWRERHAWSTARPPAAPDASVAKRRRTRRRNK